MSDISKVAKEFLTEILESRLKRKPIVIGAAISVNNLYCVGRVFNNTIRWYNEVNPSSFLDRGFFIF